MKSKKIFAAVLTGVMLSSTLVLAGCKKNEPTQPDKAAEVKYDADQTLNIIGYDFKTLDPSQASDAETFTTYTQVFEGLVREVEKNGVATTELAGAESITPNADKTEYTIKLKDTKWSDGKPVTAKDYEFNWKRQADPALASDYMTFLDEIGVKGAAEYSDKKGTADAVGVKAVDDKTLKVTLKAPTAYFESALAFKGLVPAREDIAKAQGDKYGTDYKTMVYNGPFVIADYQKGSKIVYKKNESYWDAKNVHLTTVNASVVDEPATITKMFEGKELDMAGATGDDLAKLKKSAEAGQFVYKTGMDTSSYYIYLNNDRTVLKNAKVRLALSLAFNRKQYLDVVFKRNVPSNGIVPQGIAVGTKDYRKEVPEPLTTVKDDPKKLMEDGLKELGLEASKVELTLLNSKATATSKASSEYIQKMYKDTFGINTKIVYSVDSPAYFADRSKGNFDILLGGWGADYNDVNSFFACFLSDSQNNNGKFKSADYDKLVKDAAKESDPAKRLESYKKAEQILVAKDAGIIPTYYKDVHNFQQNYLKGMYLPKFGGYYDFKNAYISGK